MSDQSKSAADRDGFGKHVKHLREARGFTQDELAALSELAADTIRRLEHQEFSPSLRTLRKLVRGLDISLTALFSSYDLLEFEIPGELIALLATRSPAERQIIAQICQDIMKALDAWKTREPGLESVPVDTAENRAKQPFGSHVRWLRVARGLTQEALAHFSKLSADTIRRLEHGSFSPSLDTLTKLCNGLELALSSLFSGFEGSGRDVAMELRDFLQSRSPADYQLALRVMFSLFGNLADLDEAQQ